MKTLRYIIVACLLMAAMQFVSCHKDTYPESFAPSIKTGTYSDVYRKGATIYGNISMEDFQIESFGVEYTILTRPGLSIEQYFATAQQVPVDAVDEDGNFSVALENLDPGIIYLYRSYVNSGYTTVYGVDSSFQTPQNTEPVFGEVSIDGITYTSFDISASLADDGGGTIEQMAYIYKEVSDGEKGELTTSTPDIQTLHVKQEEGEQQYTAQIKNLRSGKTYAIRPYAVAHGMGYGDVKYVTTKVSNGTLISECDTSDVGIGSVRLQASILAHSSQYTVSRVGFCYSQESTEPTVEHLLLTATRTGDNFEAVMNNLVLDADYYIRAYAKQSDGEYIYGDVLHYTHAMPADATFLSECEVQEVMEVNYGLILELRASVLHESSTYPIKELGFCYSAESREPTVNNLSCPAYTSDSVQFYADTWGMGVDPDKSYYIRAYAKQSNDEYVYGPVRYWRTGMPPVTYTLSFDGNGYYGWMDDQIFEAGLWQEISPNLYERSGYEFAGWNTARDGSGLSYADKQKILLTSDLTLYAQWQRISGTENGHEYVDLGLPSGTLWAACNVGADAPHDYGKYYAWGETTTKSNYDWSTYKYGTEKALTKYASDGKTSLDAEDDAARVNMGGRWCMPSLTQLEELRTHCSWTWASQSGVNGYIVTSNANGNSIFLPAAGDRNGTQDNFAASYGYYWSRSLAADASLNAANAEYLYFLAGSVGTYANHRSYGHAVRAVICEKAELTFDANGGEGTMASQLFEVGVAQAIEANAFTRADYSFAGWNTAPDGSGTAYTDGQEITLSDNLTLYAQWKATQVVSGTENGHDYVDLGLPSGTKWATCNVGATTPEGYGDYFAWGETSPKSDYSWSTYKYCEGSGTTLTKYNTDSSRGMVDNKTTLELSDDAARANWGGKWHVPTKDNLSELHNCTWTWTTQNGVNGYKVTGPNGNSIFLPAAGGRGGTNSELSGTNGLYWSSSLSDRYPFFEQCNIQFDSESIYVVPLGKPCAGLSIRAVFSETIESIVTFDANGGEGTMDAQTFEYGVPQKLRANTFTRNGYKFVGWATDGGMILFVDQQEMVQAKSITLYAQWEEIGEQVVSGTENGHDYVDLGLPSGTKWATCNVGATTPEGYGDYFAWGETAPKSNYDWSTYKYCNGAETTLTKYNTNSSFGTVDGKTTLDLSDDAARVNWGGKWRMPTTTEQQELIYNCTWTWTTQNDVNGYKVTSKTNGNSIFLPAAGLRAGTSVNDVGSACDYCSSSLGENYPGYAYVLTFNSGFVDWDNNYRYCGLAVRAVCP